MEISKQCLEITNPINTDSSIYLKESEVKEVAVVKVVAKEEEGVVKVAKEEEGVVKVTKEEEAEEEEEEVKEVEVVEPVEEAAEEVLDDNISILTIENFTEQKDYFGVIS